MATKVNSVTELVQEFLAIAQKIDFKRDPNKFVQYLIDNEFFTSPAAMRHHDARQGGLYRHSKYMFEALKNLNEFLDSPYDEQTLFYVAFGHDLCKAGIYQPKEWWYKQKNEKTGRQEWKSEKGYQIDDPFPIGHGDKSVLLMSKLVDLTQEEQLAIRWHMGAFEIGTMIDPIVRFNFSAAQQYPLVRMAHTADLTAVTMTQIRHPQEQSKRR